MPYDFLQNIRHDPSLAQRSAFTISTAPGFNQPFQDNIGNMASFSVSSFKAEGGQTIYNILVSKNENSRDYFFPYVTTGQGRPPVGMVNVPIGLPQGTIVMTGGLNGCALQVNQNNGYLLFCHDLDGKYIPSAFSPQGQILSRVTFRDYGINDILLRNTIDIEVNRVCPGATLRYFAFYPICIKIDSHRWGIYTSLIVTVSKHNDRNSQYLYIQYPPHANVISVFTEV